MNIKTVLWYALMVLCTQASLAWGGTIYGTIYNTVKMQPLNLITPLGNITPKSLFVTNIACIDASNGHYTDCAFDIRINGLVQPDTTVANNGGHSPGTHSGTRPVGDLQIIFPTIGVKTQYVYGQTNYSYVNVVHDMPEVSGKIETIYNLHVPPGWHTVSPKPCDTSFTYWCFNTTVDVGVVTDLLPLADPQTYPGLPYIRVRNNPTTDPHPNSVAFYGTINTLFFLNNIAISYQDAGYLLSVNDMSLPRGGKFDIKGDYKLVGKKSGHKYHRTGTSADINKDDNGDCLLNDQLRRAVDQEMPIKAGSPFAVRYFPSRFLCERNNNNNIHIDFDGMVF